MAWSRIQCLCGASRSYTTSMGLSVMVVGAALGAGAGEEMCNCVDDGAGVDEEAAVGEGDGGVGIVGEVRGPGRPSTTSMGLSVVVVGAVSGVDEVGDDAGEELERATGEGDGGVGTEDDSVGIEGDLLGGVGVGGAAGETLGGVRVDEGASGEILDWVGREAPAGHHRSGMFGCGGGAPAGHHL